jgi:imidazolonepropionase-like amidohydrolase
MYPSKENRFKHPILGYFPLTLLLFTLFWFETPLLAQETSFKTNGPDDFRESHFAFINAMVYKDFQTILPNATVVIKNGKIVDINTSGTFPVGAVVRDLKGKFIYPSFIDIYSDYGMPKVKKETKEEGVQYETNIKGAYGWNQAIHSDFDASRNFIKDDSTAMVYRKQGFGAVVSHQKDGIARGTATLVLLGNEKENVLIKNSRMASVFSFDKGSSTQEYPNSLMGSIALLRQTHFDANWYSKSLTTKEYNIHLEAWNENKKLISFFDAGNWETILRADKIGDEFGIQYIFRTDGSEYQRIDEIKNTKGKLIVPLNYPKAYEVSDIYKTQFVDLIEMKHWEHAPANCTYLDRNKIDFAITSDQLEKRDDFLKNLRIALKYGISESSLLKALTYNPAQFLNIYSEFGSIEKGKWANFFISDKNIFDERAQIIENWVGGKKYIIQKSEDYDIRGNYRLSTLAGMPSLLTQKMTLSGEKNAPKMQVIFTDTVKIDVKLERNGKDIAFSMIPFPSNENKKYFFTGTIDPASHSWQGIGKYPNGSEFKWIVQRDSSYTDTSKRKMDSVVITSLSKITYPMHGYGFEKLPIHENVLFKNATLWTNEAEGILKLSDLIIKNGKIVQVGKNLSCADCKIVDAAGKHLTAGIIDEHTHIALCGVNEGSKSISAEVRMGDVINPTDINIYRHLAGGVTAAQLLHGSANAIGGQSALIKMRWGYTGDQMKIEGADGFIKFALGENVKQSNWGPKFNTRYPQTRMGVEQTYVNYFTKAQEYLKNLQTDPNNTRKDLELEAMAEILNKKRFITCHSYVQSEITMLMRVAERFNFKVNTFTHILEGYKVADKMKNHGVYASSFSDWWAYKFEVIDAIPQNAGILTQMGVTTAINSDDAEMARRLNQEAAKSVKYAKMSEEDAWKMVTLNPAKMLHLDTKMGSLKVGKDADIVLWSDNPLSIYAVAERTYVDGKCFYSLEQSNTLNERIKIERAKLIQKMTEEKKAGAETQEPAKKQKYSFSCGNESECLH